MIRGPLVHLVSFRHSSWSPRHGGADLDSALPAASAEALDAAQAVGVEEGVGVVLRPGEASATQTPRGAVTVWANS